MAFNGSGNEDLAAVRRERGERRTLEKDSGGRKRRLSQILKFIIFKKDHLVTSVLGTGENLDCELISLDILNSLQSSCFRKI